MDYYLAINGQRQGPFSLDELRMQSLNLQTLVWHQGMTEWRPAAEVPELHDVCQFPPPLPTTPATATRRRKDQKRPRWGWGTLIGIWIAIAIRIFFRWWTSNH
jgi:hypothetical protein